MSVTGRFLLLAALGLPLLLLAALLPSAVTALVFWLFNLAMAVLLAVDFLLSPPASALEVQRGADSGSTKLSHKAENRISFNIHNPSAYLLRVEALDECPDRHFKLS